MPSPKQKVLARESIQHARAFLALMAEAAEKDQYQEIPELLNRTVGALFNLRQTLSMQDPAAAAIMDEYQEGT